MSEENSFVSDIAYNGKLEEIREPYNNIYFKEVLPEGAEIYKVSKVLMGFDLSEQSIELLKTQGKMSEEAYCKTATAFFFASDSTIDVHLYLDNFENDENEIQLNTNDKDCLLMRVNRAISIESETKSNVNEMLAALKYDLAPSLELLHRRQEEKLR